MRKSKNNTQRKVNTADTNRKFIYHSQIKTRDQITNERTPSNIDKVRSQRSSLLKQSPTIISFLVILGTLFYITTLNDNPQIIVDNNTSSVDFLHTKQQYQQTIKTILSSSFLNKSKFTIDSNAIARQFEADYPELDSATVIIPITGHKLQLVIKASTPVLNLQNSTGYYLLSDEGVVIKKFSSLTDMNSTKLVTLTDQSNSPAYLGKGFISSETTAFIQNIIFQYSKKGIAIAGMSLPNSPYEIDVQSRGQNFIAKYNLLNSSNYQIGIYFSILNYLKTNNLPMPTQFIDLRVSGKAFYK